MKKKRYYIKPLQATGRNLPVLRFVTLWLLFERLHVPEWLWGIYFFLMILVFCVYAYDIYKNDETIVDIQKLLKEHYEKTDQDKTKE